MSFNFAIDVLSLVIVICLCISERKNKPTGYADQQIFRILLNVIALVLLSDIPAWILDGSVLPGGTVLLYILNTVYYLGQIAYCFLWLLFVWYWRRKTSTISKKAVKLLSIPMLAESLIILTNPATGLIFSVTTDGRYERGSLYLLNLIPYFIYVFGAVVAGMVMIIKSRDSAEKKQFVLISVYMILPIFGTLIQAFNYGVSMLWPFTVLSLIMIYLNVQQQAVMENRIAAAKLEQEVTQANISVMLSQIGPHFLFNALCVIQELCHGKSPEAEEAVINFSRFLRGNLDSLSSTSPIPFEDELSHTKYYLELEKKRFGDRLNVEYSISATGFRIPALTLQPIVENAVRHGICRREDGGTVRISSGEDGEHYIISVRDNGIGFRKDVEDDGRIHVGIKNVTGRLAKMCGGSLEITSTPDIGTVVIILIPKQNDGTM